MYLAEPTGMPTGWLNWRPNRRELLRRFWGGAAGSSTGEPLPGFRGSAGRMRSAPGLRCVCRSSGQAGTGSGGDSPPMIKHFGGAVTLPGVSVEGIPAY